MRRLFEIALIAIWVMVSYSCKKDVLPVPEGGAPTISNLHFSPSSIPFKIDETVFNITGNVEFKNANNGVASIRLTTSAGADDTINVPANTEKQGTLTGTFLITRPSLPGNYTFQIWIIDNTGKSSNKLTGSVLVYADSSANNWRTIPVNLPWIVHDVIWANNRYSAVGQGGFIYHSYNGVDWTSPVSVTSHTLNAITWTGNRYVAVGNNKTILTSGDGQSWNIISTETDNQIELNGICFSGNIFVALGVDIVNNKTMMLYSRNCSDWTTANFAVAGGSFNAIINANQLFLAVGSYVKNGQAFPLIATSANGITWINRSPSTSIPGILKNLVWTGQQFVAVGSGFTATSANGSNWTIHVHPSIDLFDVAFSGSRLAAVGAGIYTSDDGKVWSQKMTDDGLGYPWKSVAWSGTQFMAMGKLYNVIVSP